MQRAAVEDLTRFHRNERLEVRRLLHSIALDLHALEHGVLQHVIREHDALWHLLHRRIEIIEITRGKDGLAILLQAARRKHIARMHGQR